MNKLCQGCRVYRTYPSEFKCGFVSLSAQKYCQCVDCLVKVVCNDKCTDRLVEYPDRISKFVKEVGSDRHL